MSYRLYIGTCPNSRRISSLLPTGQTDVEVVHATRENRPPWLAGVPTLVCADAHGRVERAWAGDDAFAAVREFAALAATRRTEDARAYASSAAAAIAPAEPRAHGGADSAEVADLPPGPATTTPPTHAPRATGRRGKSVTFGGLMQVPEDLVDPPARGTDGAFFSGRNYGQAGGDCQAAVASISDR